MPAHGGSGPVSFRVDTERLRVLQSQVNSVRRDLLDVHESRGALGSASRDVRAAGSCEVPRVDHEIDAFITRWSLGREVIEEELDGLATLIGGAIDMYESAEQANTRNR